MERMCASMVEHLKLHQARLQLRSIPKIIGRQHLALHAGKIEFDLIQPGRRGRPVV